MVHSSRKDVEANYISKARSFMFMAYLHTMCPTFQHVNNRYKYPYKSF